MSRPTPIVLIMVGAGLGLFGLHRFGVVRYEWVLALSIGLVAFGSYLYVIVKRPNQN